MIADTSVQRLNNLNHNRLMLLIVVLIGCSALAFSNQVDCTGTTEFYLGSLDGLFASRPGDFGLLSGFAVPFCIIVGVFSFAETLTINLGSETLTIIPGAILGGAIGTVISVIPHVVFKPSPPITIPQEVSEEMRQCYVEGYTWRVQRDNLRGAVIGCGIGWAASIIILGPILLLAEVVISGEF